MSEWKVIKIWDEIATIQKRLSSLEKLLKPEDQTRDDLVAVTKGEYIDNINRAIENSQKISSIEKKIDTETMTLAQAEHQIMSLNGWNIDNKKRISSLEEKINTLKIVEDRHLTDSALLAGNISRLESILDALIVEQISYHIQENIDKDGYHKELVQWHQLLVGAEKSSISLKIHCDNCGKQILWSHGLCKECAIGEDVIHENKSREDRKNASPLQKLTSPLEISHFLDTEIINKKLVEQIGEFLNDLDCFNWELNEVSNKREITNSHHLFKLEKKWKDKKKKLKKYDK